MRRRARDVPMRWYGAWLLPSGAVQTIEARTLPREQTLLGSWQRGEFVTSEGQPESTWEIMTDPVRASWPSR